MFATSDTPIPFWGSAASTKGGRDPLAVQNSSVVIYSNMITGITNVTARVRYNGFFCWLLTLIAKRLYIIDKSKVDNLSEQIKYIRRGELLLAYVMAYNFPLVTDVSGRIYADNHLESDILDLAKGADIENKGKEQIYWQNPYGVFGQYYVGVLTQLSLLFQPDAKHHTYRVTQEGFQLNELFRKCLSEELEDKFWNAIFTGMVSKNQLVDFKSISLHKIESDDELYDYQRIFCKSDREEIGGNAVNHRINSLKLLLKFIDGPGSSTDKRFIVLQFLQYNFQNVLDSNLNVTSEELSWFLYELNELSHAAYETFHFAILYKITTEPQPLEMVLDSIRNDLAEYKREYSDTTDIYELYKRIQAAHKSNDCGALVCNASYLLHQLYVLTEKYAEQLGEYSVSEGYDILHPGYAPALLARLDSGDEIVGNWEYVEKCIFYAINDHLKSSYSKSTIGQGLVHNYIVEDGLIWELRKPVPIRTSPRLQNALQYMEDMKWIDYSDNHYSILQRGNEILGK